MSNFTPTQDGQNNKFISIKKASLLFPKFTPEYLAHLLREGSIVGYQTSSGRWMVDIDSLDNFFNFAKYEERVRSERIRFERRQEKISRDIVVYEKPTLSLWTQSAQSLLVIVSGLFLGVVLYSGIVTQGPLVWLENLDGIFPAESQLASAASTLATDTLVIGEGTVTDSVYSTGANQPNQGIVILQPGTEASQIQAIRESFGGNVRLVPLSGMEGVIDISGASAENRTYVIVPSS